MMVRKGREGNTKIWWRALGKTPGRFLKKLNTALPYDPAIPLLGVHPKELKTEIQTDLCTPVFTAVSFTVAKRWKHPEGPSMDDR